MAPAALRWRHDHVRPPQAAPPLRRPGPRARRDRARAAPPRRPELRAAAESRAGGAHGDARRRAAPSSSSRSTSRSQARASAACRTPSWRSSSGCASTQATKPESDDERTEYLDDDRLDLSAWARDAIALALPDQILCRPDCAGLCPVCGKDLNAEPHEHVEERLDPRWDEAQRAAAAGMTYGVVVVSLTKPRRSRIGRLVGSAST